MVELKEVFRQSMGSLIVTNAHRIVNGEKIVTDRKDGDFFLMERQTPALAAKTIAELYAERLRAHIRILRLEIYRCFARRKRARPAR